MTCLARCNNDLTSVMPFVRHEVGENVPNVERQVAPDITLRRWDSTITRKAEIEQRLDPGAAPFQRGHQLPRRHTLMIDARGSQDTVLAPERFDPHTPDVVQVRRNRTDRTPRHAWNSEVPERRRKALDELNGDAVVRPPGCNKTGL
jgi:hypothetical protein